MKRKFSAKIFVSFVSVVLSGLTGCVTTESIGGSPTTERERKAINESKFTGGLFGTLIGGAGGYLIGASQQKRGGDLVASTLIGGAGGGIIGHEVGARKGVQAVTENREARSDRDQLQAMVAAAYDYNRQAAAYNQELSSRVGSVRQGNSLVDPQAALSDAERQHGTMAAEIQRRSQLATTLPSDSASEVHRTTAELERERAKLETSMAQLRAISQAE